MSDDWVATGWFAPASHAADADPFNALSTQEKIAVLNGLVQQGIEERLPPLLDKAGR